MSEKDKKSLQEIADAIKEMDEVGKAKAVGIVQGMAIAQKKQKGETCQQGQD